MPPDMGGMVGKAVVEARRETKNVRLVRQKVKNARLVRQESKSIPMNPLLLLLLPLPSSNLPQMLLQTSNFLRTRQSINRPRQMLLQLLATPTRRRISILTMPLVLGGMQAP